LLIAVVAAGWLGWTIFNFSGCDTRLCHLAYMMPKLGEIQRGLDAGIKTGSVQERQIDP